MEAAKLRLAPESLSPLPHLPLQLASELGGLPDRCATVTQITFTWHPLPSDRGPTKTGAVPKTWLCWISLIARALAWMHLSSHALPRFFLFEAKQNNKHTSGLVHRVLFYSDSPVFFNLTLNPFFPLTNGWPVLRCVTTGIKAQKMEKSACWKIQGGSFYSFSCWLIFVCACVVNPGCVPDPRRSSSSGPRKDQVKLYRNGMYSYSNTHNSRSHMQYIEHRLCFSTSLRPSQVLHLCITQWVVVLKTSTQIVYDSCDLFFDTE